MVLTPRISAKFRDEQKKKAVLDEKKLRAVEEKKEIAQLRVRQRQQVSAESMYSPIIICEDHFSI